MAKKNILTRLSMTILPIAVTIFIVTLFAIFWSFILANAIMVLSITGLIIIIFTVLGTFKLKKFKRSIKRRLK